MIVQYVLPTQAAGSTGGLTSYKNGPSQAVRARAYPVRVRSNASNVPKSLIAELSMLWESPLSSAQRIAWGAYAFATPLTDAYGNPKYIKGYAHFMRSNRPRMQQGYDIVWDAPATPGLAVYTLPVMTLSPDNTQVTVAFTNTDDWATTTGGALLLWLSKPISHTRNRPPEVYQPLGSIPGDTTTPPTSPWVFTVPYVPPTSQTRVFVRSSASDADGKLSGL